MVEDMSRAFYNKKGCFLNMPSTPSTPIEQA